MRCVLLVVFLAGVLTGCRTTAEGTVSGQSMKTPLPPPAFAVVPSPLDPSRPAHARGKKYIGPIVDTHLHLVHSTRGGNLDMILTQAENAGVERLLFLPTPNEARFRTKDANAANRRNLLEKGGGRIGLLCGSTYFTVWMHEAYRGGYSPDDLAARLARLERDIDAGTCLGIGEIGSYHFNKKAGQMALEFPMGFEPFLQLAGLAARKGVWLDVHAEPVTPDGKSYEAAVFGGVALLFKRHPGLKLILSHTGMTNPKNARALLETYPNLMFNLKIVKATGDLQWKNLGPITDNDSNIFEDWADLMEAMPDRFMIGTDARFGTRQYEGNQYSRKVKRLRRLLGTLNRKAADLIAHGNARHLFR